ncbi:MAG: glycosyltransferase family 4 protein [Verrucomicrobiota bacterium]
MKFLLVNHEYPPVGGGAATASYETARSLSALGHDVSVLTGHYGKLPRSTTEDSVVVRRIRCIRKRLDRSNIFEMLTFMIAAFFLLPFLLIKCRPHALIVFFTLPSGPIGLAANMFAGLPYLVSLRGGDVPGLVPELDGIHKFIAPLRRHILEQAAAVVANSEGLRRLSEQADKIPVRVIPNGVDTNFFRPSSELSSNRLRILFVGRFQEQKNLTFLLKQIARLSAGTFELHLVGDGPQRAHLRSLAQKLDIATKVVWHGWLTRDQLLRVYQSVDCLVNPSLYEGMPNVVLEAMACGLPVIASNVPGNNELVLSGETGLLFDLQQPDSFLGAIDRLLHERSQRLRMGSMAREHVRANYSWRNVAQGLETLVRETIPGVDSEQRS